MRRAAPALVFSLAFLAFLPALHNGFVNFDDDKFILGCANRFHFTWSNIVWMFTTFRVANYAPLSWLSYALDYRMWGLNPTGYHLTSVVLHAANAVVFYFIGLRLLRLADPEFCRQSDSAPYAAALFSALLFALHPLRAESVVWASERRDVLCGFFYLLSLLFYLKAQTGDPQPRRARLTASWFCFLLCLLSKGMGITLPLALILLDLYPLRRLSWNAADWLQKERSGVFLEKIPYVSLTAIFGWVGYRAQKSAAVMLAWRAYGLDARLAQASYGLTFYLLKTAVPVHLLPLYELPPRVDLLHWPFIICAIIVLVLTGLAVKFRRSWPAGFTLWFFYAGTLAPVLGLVQFGPQITADRYSYLPCLGWVLLAGYGLARAAQRLGRYKIHLFACAVFVLAVFGRLSWGQAKIWRDPQTLWRYVLSQDPDDSEARADLGVAVMDEGRLEESIRQLRQAVTLNPRSYDARYDLGNALARKGKSIQALAQYQAALALSPNSSDAFVGMGVVLYNMGAYDESLQKFALGLKADPDNLVALIDSGNDLIRKGKPERSLKFFQRALNASPSSAVAYNGLGYALAMEHRYPEALGYFSKALELDPSYTAARANWTAAVKLSQTPGK